MFHGFIVPGRMEPLMPPQLLLDGWITGAQGFVQTLSTFRRFIIRYSAFHHHSTPL
jgi:hypothetical protein